MEITHEESFIIAARVITQLAKCGALNIRDELSDEEYENYMDELTATVVGAIEGKA